MKRTPHPHDDDYRVRQDVRVSRGDRRHALCPCREVPSGCDRAKRLTSPGVAEPEQYCGRLLFVLQYCRRRPLPLDEETNTDIQQPLCSKDKPTVTTPSDPHGIGARRILSDTPPTGAGWDVPTCQTMAMARPTTIYSHLTPDTACHDRQVRRGEEGRPGSLEGPLRP